jgi:hypothetical protein
MRETEITYKIFFQETSRFEITCESLGIDGRSILQGIIKKQDVKIWTGCDWLVIGLTAGLL